MARNQIKEIGFAQRLNEFKERQGFQSTYDFAIYFNYSVTTTRKMLKGGHMPNVAFLYLLKSQYPGLNINWLLFGIGEMALPGYTEDLTKLKPSIKSGAKSQV